MSAARRTEAFLVDVRARIAWVREEFDPLAREVALEDLEHDLTTAIEWLHELDEYEAAA